ncbi:DUF6069 family protein [Nocardioides currus]|uniref:Uncharacterized protein n=1 Tax=Nocardioides currus TaxID=2133958 RepID=A0A2R7YYE1_9ACTN|nr:DUF6069 family protein [Nocardioides currus]PUA81383.1 hypothetical protein C7S10_10250 [Nocardioides currus]
MTAVTVPGAGHRLGRLAVLGLLATGAAMVVTALLAALARAVGVTLEVPEGGETIPVSGVAVVTGFFSVIGVLIAAALLRWASRPAHVFVRTALALTLVSLVPPFLVGASAATSLALVVLHLAAAAVVVPALARGLSRPSPGRPSPA